MSGLLIVDDDAGTLVTFQVAFRDAGYQVHVADCGRAALDVLTRTVPDAILLDLRLGDISGYDVLLWMRAHDITAPTAVVTGCGQFFDRIEASALGAAIYVEKPLWLDDAFWIVECLTAKSRRHDAVGAVARATPNRTLSAALLHARILSGDTAALERLAENMLASLPHRLRHAFPRVAMDVNFEAVEDAILEYALHPERFDPSRGTPLAAFLYVAAWRNVANSVRNERLRREREADYVRLQHVSPTGWAEPVEHLSHEHLRERLLATAADEWERQAIVSWLEGDHSTRGLAAALGLSELSMDDQRREVKRFKDRLLKRWYRTNRRR